MCSDAAVYSRVFRLSSVLESFTKTIGHLPYIPCGTEPLKKLMLSPNRRAVPPICLHCHPTTFFPVASKSRGSKSWPKIGYTVLFLRGVEMTEWIEPSSVGSDGPTVPLQRMFEEFSKNCGTYYVSGCGPSESYIKRWYPRDMQAVCSV